jgi:DNA-binding NtrC family response regulator
MKKNSVLIVDDEKNIRMTLGQAMEDIGLETDTAVNGEEALIKFSEKDFDLALLDLKMPGIDGMETLRRLRQTRKDVKVVIITAYGSIDSAVEAMKLGAVDFLQKPFSPQDVRDIVSKAIDRDKIDETKASDYASLTELGKRHIANERYEAARNLFEQAVSLDTAKPDAYNLLGAVTEIMGDVLKAQKYYRAALAVDPSYQPSQKNLDRTVRRRKEGEIALEYNET